MKRLLSYRAALVVLLGVGVSIWYYLSNPLRRYGVSFEETPGLSESFNHIQFFRFYKGVRHKGPEVTGSLLFVVFQDTDGDAIPEILVKSQAAKTRQAILRLNLSDDSKPLFEIIEHTLAINYPECGMYWP
jgi:hypothetical protein